MAHAIDYIYYCNFVLLLSLFIVLLLARVFRLPEPLFTAFNVAQSFEMKLAL